MRRSVLALVALAAMPIAVASAADMPLKAPPVPYVGYNWTGFYLGGEVGGGWATSQQTVVTQLVLPNGFPPGLVENPVNYSGVLGGVYGGYNYQFNQFLIGIDGDYTRANLTGTGADTSAVNGDIARASKAINWISTVTGRIGYANNNWLFFAKGGGAWAGFSQSTVTNTAAGAFSSNNSGSYTAGGWTVGGGVEYGLSAHVSLKLEYDYVQFAAATFNVAGFNAAGAASGGQRSVTSSLNILKGGIAYRF